MKKISATISACLVVGLGITGCSEANQAVNDAQKAGNQAAKQGQQVINQGKKQLNQIKLPNVNWGKYGNDLQKKIDQLGKSADCQGLRQQLDQQDKQKDGPVVQYIQAQMKKAGC